MIRAETHPDDHAIEVYFDAQTFFEQATDKQITNILLCDTSYIPKKWGNNEALGQSYPTDDVAIWAADHNEQVADMFTYIEIRGNVQKTGFECYIHANDLKKWVTENRPHLLDENPSRS